ncbi:MAG: hypothetical protein HQL27_03115 [Candidatus Omnitrophica bacterium]|nr:hypothetical protein [Candidatus Omnitrophota bacterium]
MNTKTKKLFDIIPPAIKISVLALLIFAAFPARSAFAVLDIFRSVGTSTADLNAATGASVNITGTTATFSTGLATNVGVGDVLQYNPGSGLTVAFISGRTSATVFSVQSQNGGTPTAAGDGTAVNIYRAFNSLFGWESQLVANVNASINDAVDDTVLYASLNLTFGNANAIYYVACYADGEDTGGFTLINAFTVDSTHYVHIYTPTNTTTQVGISQRHTGKPNTGYRRDNGIRVAPGYTRIDGLSITYTGNTYNGLALSAGVNSYYFSNNYIDLTHETTTKSGITDFSSGITGATMYIWNNIIILASSGALGISVADGDTTAYVYNNTVISPNADGVNGVGIYTAVDNVTLKNNLVYTVTAGSGYLGDVAFTSVTYCASGDATADDWAGAGNRINQPFRFVNSASKDYHIAGKDRSVLNYGTTASDANINPDGTDIDGTTRPLNGTWDIGADEATITPLMGAFIAVNGSR